MDIRLALMAGTDIPVPACKVTIHQPTLKEIAFIGETEFFMGVQTLTLNKTMFSQDKDVLDKITNFQIFMMIMNDPSTVDKKDCVKTLLTIICPKYNVLITPQSLIFQEKESQESNIIDENNFEILQESFRQIFCATTGPMDQQAFNPANKKAKEIADKIMRGRKRVAEQNGTANTSVFSQYLSALTIGLHIHLLDLVNLTMYQLYDLVERYMLYTNWDVDLKCRLAGGKPDSQPDNWMKNIH